MVIWMHLTSRAVRHIGATQLVVPCPRRVPTDHDAATRNHRQRLQVNFPDFLARRPPWPDAVARCRHCRIWLLIDQGSATLRCGPCPRGGWLLLQR
jgi:hypothetical protein